MICYTIVFLPPNVLLFVITSINLSFADTALIQGSVSFLPIKGDERKLSVTIISYLALIEGLVGFRMDTGQ